MVPYFCCFVFTGEKGSAVNMLKFGSKRRRTMKQIKAEKQAEQDKNQIIQDKLAAYAQMEQEHAQMQQRVQKLEQ